MSGSSGDQASTVQTGSKNTSLKASLSRLRQGLSERLHKPPVEQVRAFELPEGPLNFGGFRCYALNNKKFLAALSRALNRETGGFSRLITEGPDGGRVYHISASTR